MSLKTEFKDFFFPPVKSFLKTYGGIIAAIVFLHLLVALAFSDCGTNPEPLPKGSIETKENIAEKRGELKGVENTNRELEEAAANQADNSAGKLQEFDEAKENVQQVERTDYNGTSVDSANRKRCAAFPERCR